MKNLHLILKKNLDTIKIGFIGQTFLNNKIRCTSKTNAFYVICRKFNYIKYRIKYFCTFLLRGRFELLLCFFSMLLFLYYSCSCYTARYRGNHVYTLLQFYHIINLSEKNLIIFIIIAKYVPSLWQPLIYLVLCLSYKTLRDVIICRIEWTPEDIGVNK